MAQGKQARAPSSGQQPTGRPRPKSRSPLKRQSRTKADINRQEDEDGQRANLHISHGRGEAGNAAGKPGRSQDVKPRAPGVNARSPPEKGPPSTVHPQAAANRRAQGNAAQRPSPMLPQHVAVGNRKRRTASGTSSQELFSEDVPHARTVTAHKEGRKPVSTDGRLKARAKARAKPDHRPQTQTLMRKVGPTKRRKGVSCVELTSAPVFAIAAGRLAIFSLKRRCSGA